MESASKGNPIQGFALSRIMTGVNTLEGDALAEIQGIRLATEAAYYVNGDTANVTTMPPGVTIIDHRRLTSITFTPAVTLEVMLP